MDNLILFVIQPGMYPEPDKRTLVRLLKSLCSKYIYGELDTVPMYNQYTCFESPVMNVVKQVIRSKYISSDSINLTSPDSVNYFTGEVIRLCKDTIVDEIVRVWWIFNGMPTILDHRETGRYVRRMLRIHRVQHI